MHLQKGRSSKIFPEAILPHLPVQEQPCIEEQEVPQASSSNTGNDASLRTQLTYYIYNNFINDPVSFIY